MLVSKYMFLTLENHLKVFLGIYNCSFLGILPLFFKSMPIIFIRVILGDELQLHIIIISMLILNKFIWLKVCLTIEQMLK